MVHITNIKKIRRLVVCPGLFSVGGLFPGGWGKKKKKDREYFAG
jgi:hypothetical protein